MADPILIIPRDLPPAIEVFASDALVVDDGTIVAKATPQLIVNAGAPVASQAEAIAGADNTKRMTALRTKQVLDNVTAPSVLRAQAWAESATNPDPAYPDSRSSKSWAEESAAIGAEVINQAPFAVKDAPDFFGRSVLTIGARYWSKDGLAWDIVAAGAGDFNHPVTGQGVRVVAVGGEIFLSQMTSPQSQAQQFLSTYARFNGDAETYNFSGNTPFFTFTGEDDVSIENGRFVGPGKNSGSSSFITDGGASNTNRMFLKNVAIRDAEAGIHLRSGWGHVLQQFQAVSLGTGIRSTSSTIETGWAGSGHMVVGGYFAGCDVGIDDSSQWCMTYINPVIEDCTLGYKQNTEGTTTVMINPWFEDNTNPPEWRRGSVVLGGRDVNTTDIQLWSGRPTESLTVIDRFGIDIKRTGLISTLKVDGVGVKFFRGSLTDIGFTSNYSTSNVFKAFQVRASQSDGSGGIISARSASSATQSDNMSAMSDFYSTYNNGDLNLAVSASLPIARSGAEAERSTAGNGFAIGHWGVYTGRVTVTAGTPVRSQYGKRLDIDGLGNTVPGSDNTQSFGSFALRWLKGWFGNISLFPAASVTPANNGEVTFQLTSDTQLTFKVKGSDGVVRSASVTLS